MAGPLQRDRSELMGMGSRKGFERKPGPQRLPLPEAWLLGQAGDTGW